MARLLAERGYAFTTTGEREIVRDLKETCAYVALDFGEELAARECSSSTENNYKLPDGQLIDVGDACFRCPEALFKPSIIGIEEMGIAELLRDSVSRCTPDLHRELYRRIIVSGGKSTSVCGQMRE